MMSAIIIPARLKSSRLRRKLLLDDTGFPLLWHTTQRALESTLAQVVIIATEDQEIVDTVALFGVEDVYCVHTPPCNSGTERVAWVVENIQKFSDFFDVVVNFQGDEPELPGTLADTLIRELQKDNMVDVTTLATKGNVNEYDAPSVVKVVTDHCGNAMYFSRAPIPHGSNDGCLTHFGIYAYRREFLLAFPTLPETTLGSERLEQLQWLQSGFRIRVLTKEINCVGVDTKREYDNFVRRYRKAERILRRGNPPFSPEN